jgi:Fur family ferric uptake transcriptional regulator
VHIIKATCMQEDTHFSCSEIYDQIKKTDPTIGIATIYRTVRLLEKEGILEQLYTKKDKKHRLIASGDFLVCPHCGAVSVIKSRHMKQDLCRLLLVYGYPALDCKMRAVCVCDACAQSAAFRNA